VNVNPGLGSDPGENDGKSVREEEYWLAANKEFATLTSKTHTEKRTSIGHLVISPSILNAYHSTMQDPVPILRI